LGNELGEPVSKEAAGELWRATCGRAKITDLDFHDLRRKFGCRFMESGASAHETRDALGHSNLTMTNQYLSTSGIGLARPFARFEQREQQAARKGDQAGAGPNPAAGGSGGERFNKSSSSAFDAPPPASKP
jgi:hypothetical protein